MKFILPFESISMQDVARVGGKNASLGEMITHLNKAGIIVPDGFAISADAYWYYVKENNLLPILQEQLAQLTDSYDISKLQHVGSVIRQHFINATMPSDLGQEIIESYEQLCKKYGERSLPVAVRSSATAEDLPGASFAGQQESFLYISKKNLLDACKQCFASLFTDRAIVYRLEKGFDHLKVALSIGVQKMVRADNASSGVAFSLDTETGFKDAIIINAAWGLGETIVQGLVLPDEYWVHKPTLEQGFAPIIKKLASRKDKKRMYDKKTKQVKTIKVKPNQRALFCLDDKEIIALTRMVASIEHYYSTLNNQWTPMDVEWAKDAVDGTIYIIQARPETVHVQKKNITYTLFSMPSRPTISLLSGQSIGQAIVQGKVRVISDVSQLDQVQSGEILVTQMTDPDWVPVMKKVKAIITDLGGRTCHAAIVSREMGTPALVGAQLATKKLTTGQMITLDCSQGSTGFVYDGAISFEKEEIVVDQLPQSPVSLLMNIAQPDAAFVHQKLPVDGVGLARVEFIIANDIQIHPMALLFPDRVNDKKIEKKIAQKIEAYPSGPDYFIYLLAQGIGSIAAAFYPRPVIVRFSDFKTNEYRNLIGGNYFETSEANPMMGFRGAIRYYSDKFKDAFALECAAIKKVRETMGLTNVQVMIPFVRTLDELQKVLQVMEECGLKRHDNDLKIIMMCEIPSNVLLIEQFSHYVDGFSIGSNDLTQFTLAVDRDSQLLAQHFDERDEAVKKFIHMAIEGAHTAQSRIGICGQAPSDYPAFALFLIKQQIDSISLNPDAIVPFLSTLSR